jgi:hypothetical protein
MTENQAESTPVVVTTEHRGVFFGFLAGPRDGKTVELTGAQMCVYWSADVKGILGLASSGPSRSCRITRPVPRITLQAVTAVIDVTDEAVKLWQDRPWS